MHGIPLLRRIITTFSQSQRADILWWTVFHLLCVSLAEPATAVLSVGRVLIMGNTFQKKGKLFWLWNVPAGNAKPRGLSDGVKTL